MVLILNLLLIVVGVGAIALAWKLKKVWPLVVAIVFMFLVSFARPSYMPKGVIERMALPDFEVNSELIIQDRNRSPLSGKEYDEILKKKITDGLPFIERGDEK